MTRIDGSVVTGRLTELTAEDVTLRPETGPVRRIATTDVLLVEFPHPEAAAPGGPFVLLANGDRLSVSPLRTAEEALVARWTAHPDRAPLTIPLETVQAALLEPPRPAGARRLLVRELLAGGFETDVLVLAGPGRDRLTGELLEVADEAFRIETAVGPVSIERERVVALGLSAALISLPPPEPRRAVVWLTDGSRVTLHDVAAAPEGGLDGTTVFGESLSVPLGEVRRLDFFSERVVPLSELAPAGFDATPYLSHAPGLRRDRNVRGGVLRLRGVEYATGLGMTSGATAAYALAEFALFRAVVGIDDDADGGGSAVFTIDADGRRLFTSPLLTGRSDPVVVGPLDVAGVRELSLSVEFGEYGNIRDLADWCHAVLVRREPVPPGDTTGNGH